MSWADDFLNERKGAAAASSPAPAVNNPFAEQPGFIGGMIASGLSSLPEMFGAQPTETADVFRAQHPIAGFVSEMIPAALPYVGIEAAASRLPSVGRAVQAGTDLITGRLGLGIGEEALAAAPIRTAMAKNAVMFTPFEVSRLAVGGLTNPEHLDSLFGDVLLSSAFTVGGAGVLGGLVRAGGKVLKSAESRVLGADLFTAPTFELRQSLEPGAEMVGGTSVLEHRAQLTQKVFAEEPPRSGIDNKQLPYIQNMVGATSKEDVDLNNALFKLSDKKKGAGEGVLTRSFLETEPEIKNSLDPGEREAVLSKIGFESATDFAAVTQFPRVQDVPTPRAAGMLAKTLDNPTWKSAGDDVRWSRSENGLFAMAVRVDSGKAKAVAEAAGDAAAAGKVRARGVSRVAPGDRWVTFLTDQPGKFAPDLQRIADGTVAEWAKWRLPYQRSIQGDVFNRQNDTILRTVGQQDWNDMRRMTKQSWLAEKTEKASAKVADTMGLRDSAVVRSTLEFAYDTLKPQMFKEYQDTLYGRLFGLLRGNIETSDRFLHQAMRGTAEVKGSGYGVLFKPKSAINLDKGFRGISGLQHDPLFKRVYASGLTDDDASQIFHIGNAKVPVEDLDSLVAEGSLSAKAADFLKYARELDSDMLNTIVRPALSPMEEYRSMPFFEGYYTPRIFDGDFRVQVMDKDTGREVFLAAGKTAQMAQRDAGIVIEEGKKAGKTYYAQEMKSVLDDDSAVVSDMMRDVGFGIQSGSDEHKVITAALHRIGQLDNKGPRIRAGKPATLAQRTGRAGSPDIKNYTLDDLAHAYESHYRKLFRWTARQSWQERFGSEAFLLSTKNPTLYKDLMHKANQYIGMQGEFSRALNKVLDPLLSPVLGKNAATKIASATNNVIYQMQLGLFNPTFALLNALTPVMTTLPQIAYALHVPRFEAEKFFHYHPTFDETGKAIGAAGSLQPLKILWQAYKDMGKPPEDLQQMYGRLIDDGKLAAHLRDEITGPHSPAYQTMREMLKGGNYLKFLKEGTTYMADKSEQFTRIVSANAGWRVGKDVIGLEGEALYRYVARFTEVANFNYGVVDRPKLFTGPLGSMFGLFKNWQMHYMGMMINYADAGWRYNTWSPLLWQQASGLALGGLGATPLMHLANGLSNWYGNEPDSYKWMLENWHDGADNIWYGLPSFLGVSFQASSTIPGTDVRNEISSLGNFVILERAKQIGKALGAASQYQTATGQNALRDPNVRDGLLGALTPRAFYRAVSVVEGDYIKSMGTGAPQIQNVSPAVRMMQGLGINNVETEKYQHAANQLYEAQTERRDMIQGLGREYADGMGNKDSEAMQRVITRTVALQLPVDKVIQSAMTRNRREHGDLLSRYDKGDRARWMAAFNGGGQ
jgi:hypothetical protein